MVWIFCLLNKVLFYNYQISLFTCLIILYIVFRNR